MPAVITPLSGLVMEVSAAAPATFDETGYNALTWSAFNDYDTVPDLGDAFEVQNFDGVRNGRTPYVGIQDGGSTTMNVPDDATDPGLIVVLAQFQTPQKLISIRLRDSNDNYTAARAIVASYVKTGGGARDLVNRRIELATIPGTIAEGDASP